MIEIETLPGNDFMILWTVRKIMDMSFLPHPIMSILGDLIALIKLSQYMDLWVNNTFREMDNDQ